MKTNYVKTKPESKDLDAKGNRLHMGMKKL